ncbi:hypothetical protein SDC9_168992 [bioreactor metagenome]|uniref:Uncharacterized protein n=1 Tax=bioreactor metagenome TaxID=1076179 RepID=A0A645G6M6_9ZZZZ
MAYPAAAGIKQRRINTEVGNDRIGEASGQPAVGGQIDPLRIIHREAAREPVFGIDIIFHQRLKRFEGIALGGAFVAVGQDPRGGAEGNQRRQ